MAEKDVLQPHLADGSDNPFVYYGVQKIAEQYNLVEYEIVNIDFTMAHSEAALEMGPQYGNGTYNRSFIVGKAKGDEHYKIYDFGMMQ